jgi:hypothetical protein
MNQYLLSVYDVEGDGAGAPSTPEEMQALMGRVIALEEEMDRAGAFEFGARCTVRTLPPWCEVGTGLDKVTTDGPFVEAKERIGGFYMISADNLDEALAWAAKVVEAINHDIEVRPFRATGRLQDAPGTEAVVDGPRQVQDQGGPHPLPSSRRDELPDRLRAVLSVLYLIYNAGADDVRRRDLRAEAIRLTRNSAEIPLDGAGTATDEEPAFFTGYN